MFYSVSPQDVNYYISPSQIQIHYLYSLLCYAKDLTSPLDEVAQVDEVDNQIFSSDHHSEKSF